MNVIKRGGYREGLEGSFELLAMSGELVFTWVGKSLSIILTGQRLDLLRCAHTRLPKLKFLTFHP